MGIQPRDILCEKNVPLVKDSGSPGKSRKVHTSKMEMTPFILCVHKKVDNSDTWFTGLHGPKLPNPCTPHLAPIKVILINAPLILDPVGFHTCICQTTRGI